LISNKNRMWKMVWDCVKKDTAELVLAARDEGYEAGIKDEIENSKKQIKDIIQKSSGEMINIKAFVVKSKEAKEKMLIAQKSEDDIKANYYRGMVDLFNEVAQEKIN